MKSQDRNDIIVCYGGIVRGDISKNTSTGGIIDFPE